MHTSGAVGNFNFTRASLGRIAVIPLEVRGGFLVWLSLSDVVRSGRQTPIDCTPQPYHINVGYKTKKFPSLVLPLAVPVLVTVLEG